MLHIKCPALTLNSTLNQQSQEYAQKLLKQKTLQHSGDKKNGENLYYFMSSDKKRQVTGLMPVEEWYSEIKFYNFKEPSTAGFKAGHFTQVIWKGTKEMGVGIAQHDGKCYVVAKYYPPGNVIGKFEENVPAK